MLKFPAKKINGIYGYRTSNSMKSQERWDFAQLYSAKEMIRAGAILSFSSLMGLFYNPQVGIGTAIGLGLMIAIIITLMLKTEKAITKRFGKPY